MHISKSLNLNVVNTQLYELKICIFSIIKIVGQRVHVYKTVDKQMHKYERKRALKEWEIILVL